MFLFKGPPPPLFGPFNLNSVLLDVRIDLLSFVSRLCSYLMQPCSLPYVSFTNELNEQLIGQLSTLKACYLEQTCLTSKTSLYFIHLGYLPASVPGRTLSCFGVISLSFINGRFHPIDLSFLDHVKYFLNAKLLQVARSPCT